MDVSKENIKVTVAELEEIKNIENEHGVSVFRMAMTSLMEVGINNFNDDYVKETIDKIMLGGPKGGSDGIQVITAYELQGKVLRCFEKLAKYPPWTLVLYIKMCMEFD